MAVHASHAALPYPIKNCRYSMLVPLLDADGDPTAQTTPDTEISEDNAAATDAAEEVSATSGMDGMGLITFSGAETDCSTLAVNFKASSGPKATLATIYPRVLAEVGTGTLSAGSAGGGTLGTLLAYDVTGCFIKTTGGTGGGGTGGANNQVRRIITYNTGTGAFTVAPNWETTPSTDTTYAVLLPEGVTLGMLKALNPATAGRTLTVGTDGYGDARVRTLGASAYPIYYHEVGSSYSFLGVNLEYIKQQTITCAGGVTIPAATLASTTNITGGTITTVTNVTNAVSANVTQISGDSTAADNLEAALDGTGGVTITANVTGNITGNLSGSVGSVTGAVGSVTGAVGSVTAGVTLANGAHGGAAATMQLGGAGGLTGNITGNLSGSVGSVTGAVGSVTGNVGGNVAGSVGSVTGNVGGNVAGSVGSVTANVNAVLINGAHGGAAATLNLSGGLTVGDITTADWTIGTISGAEISVQTFSAITSFTIANVQHVAQTGDAFARIGAPAGASLAADVAAVKVDTAATLADTGTDGVVVAAASKTGYALSAAGVDAIWDEPQSGHATAGTFGLYLDAKVSEAGGGGLTVGAIADAVWDEALSGHATAGSAGAGLSAAQSAGDPWSTSLPGAYAAGTAGYTIGNLISLVWSAGTRTVTNVVSQAVSPMQTGTLSIVRGDTYANAQGTQKTISKASGATWPTDLTGGTITFTARRNTQDKEDGTTEGDASVTSTGAIVTATGDSQAVRFDLTASQTDGLTCGAHVYDYDVQWASGSVRWTLERGTLTVYADQTLT